MMMKFNDEQQVIEWFVEKIKKHTPLNEQSEIVNWLNHNFETMSTQYCMEMCAPFICNNVPVFINKIASRVVK